MKIVGAGLAGLLAAHAWPGAEIFESAPAPRAAHRALLRFRSNAVAQLTGIEFREVTVRKGIWHDEEFIAPSIRLSNWYSRKVTGSILSDRSIWSLDPAQRFIAPESFYDQLIETVGSRIHWATSFAFTEQGAPAPLISTAPLPITLKALAIETSNLSFHRASIHVDRFRVKNSDVFQTVYFPDPELALYRASITGSLLICESINNDNLEETLRPAFEALGLSMSEPELIESADQHYGKIVPLSNAVRKPLLHRLTTEHSIFSLGRFATWRNILLDDVVQDISVIRKLIKASGYDRAIFAS